MGTKADNLASFEPWEKMQLEVFVKDGCDTVRMVTEYNQHYGDLVTAFQIGEDSHDTGVQDKYIPEHVIILQESSSLCGVREFEDGSITYEFLWKPLGLDISMVYRRPYHDEGKAYWTQFYHLKKAMQKAGYTQVR